MNAPMFGIESPVADPLGYRLGLPQVAPQAPIQTGLNLGTESSPYGAAARTLLKPEVSWLPGKNPAQQQTPYAAPLAAGLGGMQAAQAGTQAYDTKSGVISALGAGAAGAATGAVVGGVPGAIVGGTVGLGLGALNAWMAVGKENKAARDRKKILSEAKAEQDRRDKIARDDAIDGLAFERGQIEEAKRLEEWKRNRALIAEASAKKKARSEEFISRGFVT